MSRIDIRTDPVSYHRFAGYLAARDSASAVRFLRENNLTIPPALVAFDVLERYERLEKQNPREAAVFYARQSSVIRAEREAKAALEDLHRGGPGALKSEVIADLVARKDLPAVERVDHLRRLGADREAEIVRQKHAVEIGAARVAKSRADDAAAKAKASRDKAIAERLGPRAAMERESYDAEYRVQLGNVRARYRHKDGVHEDAAGYVEEKRALDKRFNDAWSARSAELQKAAEAEVDAPPPGAA